MARWVQVVSLALLVFSPAGAPVRAQGAAGATRIVVFDPEAMWALTEVGKKYSQDLTVARDTLQGNIDKKKSEIDAIKDRLRRQQAGPGDDKTAQMQRDVQNKAIELNRLTDDATREMKVQLDEVQNRFQQMLLETIGAYGKEKNFALIFEKGAIAYASPAIDITQDLIAKFNNMHKAGAPSSPKPQPKKSPETPKRPSKPPGRT
jgi:outer membrane protein